MLIPELTAPQARVLVDTALVNFQNILPDLSASSSKEIKSDKPGHGLSRLEAVLDIASLLLASCYLPYLVYMYTYSVCRKSIWRLPLTRI